MATTLLLKFGVKRVICKARTRTQKSILETLGAHQVILPEHEAGVHLGRKLATRHFIDYLEVVMTSVSLKLKRHPVYMAKHWLNVICVNGWD
ncbi:MAG: hypothetical protein M5U34_39245 [Chloroflexi bacterium]|nr:hypothetical protein [Chloroflexota bacterium]